MKRRDRNEEGAVAVMVALMAVLLIGVVGVVVDLGNAWARGRAVQSQADVSAISAGHLLPMQAGVVGRDGPAVAGEVARWFNENAVAGQTPSVTASQLLDGNRDNGEVAFHRSAADAAAGVSCTTMCAAMSVVAPSAAVGFGFAAVLPGVGDGVGVQRSSVVAVESELPPMQDMLPFWLPSGCGYGPVQADTSQGGGSASQNTSPTSTASPSPSQSAEAGTPLTSPPSPQPVGGHTLVGAATVEVPASSTRAMTNYSVTGMSNAYKKATIRAISPDGTRFVDFAAEASAQGKVPDFQIGPGDLTSTSGTWYLFALAAKKNGDVAYSGNYLTVRVGNSSSATPSPTPTSSTTPSATPSMSGDPAGCVGQDRGNFGQLSSPRADESNDQKAFARNVALGLDHRLTRFATAGDSKSCGSGSSLLPGARLDLVGGRSGDGANCIVGDTGNDGPKTYDGLVGGLGDGIPGRLAADNGPTTCPGRTDALEGGVLLNNDTLACFLRNGATLSQLADSSGVTTSMLDPAIVRSPRFVYLPIVSASDRAQKSYQPIRTFVPGFITSETLESGPATSGINGLDINGNSVKVLRVFVFNRDALPPSASSESAAYDPVLGGAIVRLVG